MNVFEITLDVDKRRNKESVNLRQGDINGTTIKANLRDHDVPMEGGSYTAAFCMTLPDRKTYYWTEATYADGVVSVVVDERYAASIAGATNNAYFELYENDELKYTTASFIVRIKPSAMDGQAAHSYDSRVEELMTEMREVIDDETVAEAERKAAELERASNERTRIDTFAANEAERSETFTVNEGRRAATFVETEGARSVLFTSNEDERSSTFETNEAGRIATFNANEADRIDTFEANESERQSTYDSDSAEWTAAETARANTFANNEQTRQSTFEENEQARQARYDDSFYPPSVSVEETATGQVAHITWKNSQGIQTSDMVIDDAINVSMTGDTFSIPVDPSGVCTESGTARFYFAGWIGNRMSPATATSTAAPDSRFTVRYTASTNREMGLVRIDYLAGTTYPALVDVCTLSFSCGGRTFLHRIEAVAPRGGAGVTETSPDVISHDSFVEFCAALEQAANLTITETWNSSAKKYEYNIVSGS